MALLYLRRIGRGGVTRLPGGRSTQQERRSPPGLSMPAFLFLDLLTRFARLSFVPRVFRVLKDALWVPAEPYRGVPAKLARVPFFIAATNKAAALFSGLSLPGVLFEAVRHTDVLQPLNVRGAAPRRAGRAPRVR